MAQDAGGRIRGFAPARARRLTRAALAAGLAATALLAGAVAGQAQEARAILKRAFDNWRANSSHVLVDMEIRRPGKPVRRLSLESWTLGTDKALVRFTAPPRDAGNATLQLGGSTWVFNPKLNQVIKLPASAMSQSWMGSDFSYDDLARSQRVIDDFTHRVIGTKTHQGRKVWVIESVPKRGRPVVWGKEVLEIRDDGVLLSVGYYDQLGRRVRVMTADRVAMMGGRPYPVVMTMKRDDKPGRSTRIITKRAEFDIPVPGWLFTRSNLANPRN